MGTIVRFFFDFFQIDCVYFLTSEFRFSNFKISEGTNFKIIIVREQCTIFVQKNLIQKTVWSEPMNHKKNFIQELMYS